MFLLHLDLQPDCLALFVLLGALIAPCVERRDLPRRQGLAGHRGIGLRVQRAPCQAAGGEGPQDARAPPPAEGEDR